ncbi:MAG: FRG domain-containing protein, partial [Chloroflexi bacterium]|nr:FRG domain-containing protein [Chloroflexota bacterium]
MELEGKVAVVIGASRGCGKYFALGLAKAGAAVTVAARTVEPGPLPGTVNETAEQIRQEGGKALWEDGFYQTMRDRYLTAFQEAASGLRGASPSGLNDDQWWALGRHYGLVTPIRDWTEKPYIAAFFALTDLWSKLDKRRGIKFEGKEVAIYRLFHNEQLEGDGLRVVKPLVDELGRIHGQRGLFTWVDSE